MTNHESVIDFDINELAALLISQGELGRKAMTSLLDESFSSLGPITNLLVQNAMSSEDRAEEFELQRNYTGSILENKLIAEKIERLGTTIMSERGLIEDGEFTNPIIRPIASILSTPHRVIHNVTMLADYTRDEFVRKMADRIGAEAAEQSIPSDPPNGYSFPVTSYAATIISTERGGVVIAPNDFNSMLFDFQLIPAIPVASFVKQLVEVAVSLDSDSQRRTIVYGSKIPGGTEINAAVFSDEDGRWSAAFDTPESDIEYLPLLDENNDPVGGGILVASNRTDLLEASKMREETSLPNSVSAADYIARLSTIPLAKRAEEAQTEPKE